ncbi:MAG TPA: hypothetical protein VM760_02950 [Sphingomicrobium sp.]|jgi:hypothetical protein|nr:hypothetical protein [Sphingomicrobium sp.]
MKAFFWSVLGAVLSAVLIYFVNGYFESRDSQNKYQIDYSIDGSELKIKKEDFAEIGKGIGKYSDDISISRISVVNSGSQPVANQEAIVRVGTVSELSGGIIKAASEKLPGSDPDSVKMTINKDRLTVKYSLLNPAEEHTFWLAYDTYGSPSFTMRKPGLSVTEIDKDEALGNGWDFGSVLMAAVAGLLIFLGGIMITSLSIKEDLKTRGFDLDSMMKSKKIDKPKEDS